MTISINTFALVNLLLFWPSYCSTSNKLVEEKAENGVIGLFKIIIFLFYTVLPFFQRIV